MWNFACPDWGARLESGRTVVPDLPLDLVEAEKAVRIFDKLRLPDVPGQPLMLDAAGEWFRDIVRAAFGSLDKATGERLVSEIFTLVPKKNSKTTGGAAIAITALLTNQRPHAEMLLVNAFSVNLAVTGPTGIIIAGALLGGSNNASWTGLTLDIDEVTLGTTAVRKTSQPKRHGPLLCRRRVRWRAMRFWSRRVGLECLA
jgi:hypothetical protein